MRNIPIVGKFLALMAIFGLFCLTTAFYSGGRIMTIDDSYSSLLIHEAKAATTTARAARFFQQSRAAIGSILLANTDEGNAKGVA